MIYSITNVSEAIWSYVTSEIKDWATLLESVANFTQYSWAPNDKSLHDLRQPCNHDITKSQVSQMAVCLCSLFLVLTIHLGIYLSCLFFPRFSHWAKLSSMNGGSIIWSSPLHFRERKLCRPSRSKFGDLKSFASSKTNDLQAQHLLVLARWVFRCKYLFWRAKKQYFWLRANEQVLSRRTFSKRKEGSSSTRHGVIHCSVKWEHCEEVFF